MSAFKSNAAPSRVLLVEDNPLIALDAEETLHGLGVAAVAIAGSSDVALALIAADPPECALLDFNLGGETSEPVARELARRGIPFAFVTGYGDLDRATDPIGAAVAIVRKPSSRADLSAALQACARRLTGYLGRAIRQRPSRAKATAPIPAA